MKALVGWNTLYQVPELINSIKFYTRIKNDKEYEPKGTQGTLKSKLFFFLFHFL